jgi:uncharacterized protein (DUF924 family)
MSATQRKGLLMVPADIVDFWREAGPKRWYAKEPAFDEEIRQRFEATHHAAARGEYAGWADSANGALALLILLDQFPRNLYRDSAHAFATDGLARQVASDAIERGHDRAADPALREFFYLPFAHAEDLQIQDRGVELSRAAGQEAGEAHPGMWSLLHREIIAKFGRFPHRNAGLGRTTTPDEQAFLDAGGFAG